MKKKETIRKAVIYLCDGSRLKENAFLTSQEVCYAREVFDRKESYCYLPVPEARVLVFFPESVGSESSRLEKIRIAASDVYALLEKEKISDARISDVAWGKAEEVEAFAEGICLSSYRFDTFKSKKAEPVNISLESKTIKKKFSELTRLAQEVNRSKYLVDLPFSSLNATRLAQWAAKDAGPLQIKVKNWTEAAIKKAGMGGLLGVNRGSVDKPAFTQMEYRPSKPINKKPIVLVGKGVVFDAGGMNIKTGAYMEDMKTDMAGAALVIGIMRSVAFLKLPLHVCGLIPATDNRLNGNALVCGDVITMYGGTTVEITNTDAEGRLLLADAVAYASSMLDPELIVTMATLTGAASRALGPHGIAAMQQDADKYVPTLTAAGEKTYERVCFFPMWDEYRQELKSEVADLKNCGNGPAGMITAAQFIQHFSQVPFLHLDVAGVEYLHKRDGYRGPGATACGIRLMVEFLKTLCQ